MVATAEEVEVDQQVIELIQFHLLCVVCRLGDDLMISIVKLHSEATKEATHSDINHCMAVIERRIDQIGSSVCGNKIVSSPEITMQQ